MHNTSMDATLQESSRRTEHDYKRFPIGPIPTGVDLSIHKRAASWPPVSQPSHSRCQCSMLPLIQSPLHLSPSGSCSQTHSDATIGMQATIGSRGCSGGGSKRRLGVFGKYDEGLVPLHDAVMLYARAVKQLLKEGGKSRDGQAVTSALRNTTFEGAAGLVLLDAHGDRIESYEVMNYSFSGSFLGLLGFIEDLPQPRVLCHENKSEPDLGFPSPLWHFRGRLEWGIKRKIFCCDTSPVVNGARDRELGVRARHLVFAHILKGPWVFARVATYRFMDRSMDNTRYMHLTKH